MKFNTTIKNFTGLKRQMKGDNLPDLFIEKSCRIGVNIKQIS